MPFTSHRDMPYIWDHDNTMEAPPTAPLIKASRNIHKKTKGVPRKTDNKGSEEAEVLSITRASENQPH